MPSIFIRDKPIFLSERMLHKDYYCKGSVEKKKIYGRDSQGAWLQDELIGSKAPDVKQLWLWLKPVSCKPGAIQWGCEHRSRGISIAGSCYLATCGKDTEALMFGVVICSMCMSVKLLQLPVVTSYKCSINQIINPIAGRAIKLTVVIIMGYHCYQLHTKCYPISFSQD
jgi:hypothetical protein